MNPSQRGGLYELPDGKDEQELKENNPPQEGGLPETSWLAPGVSASFRTTFFLCECHKPNSLHRVGFDLRGVFGRQWATTTQLMHDRPVPTGVAQRPSLYQRILGVFMNRRNGCYTLSQQVSHGKTHYVASDVTDVTDVTANERGCTWHAYAGMRARRARHLHTPLSRGVTSVTSVTSPEPYSGFDVLSSRNIGDHVTATAGSGVVT